MGFYWVPVLIGALGVVLLLAAAVVTVSHVRRLTHTMERSRARTSMVVRPLTQQAARLRTRR
ncbi:hypothetical protein [Pseudonocardia xishanensis]|uniref:Histidine kinase n=1 Tax=Pseudonocardia xishanensis TaxID=630995 RepID=A0ABP8RGR9_9PSEU